MLISKRRADSWNKAFLDDDERDYQYATRGNNRIQTVSFIPQSRSFGYDYSDLMFTSRYLDSLLCRTDVYHRTDEHDPFAISLLTVAEFAPVIFFSFIGGTFADRWRPKRTLIVCDLLNAVFVFIVLIAFLFISWKAVFLVPLAYASFMQFSQPAGFKLFKKHLQENQLKIGLAIYQTAFSIFILLGPVIGTFVFQRFGVDVAIAIMGMMYLLSALVQTLLPHDQQTKGEQAKTAILFEMKAGFRYVFSKRKLKRVGICFILSYLGFGLVQPLSVFLVSERLALGNEWLQWLLTANGAGTALSGLLVITAAKRFSPQHLVMIGIIVSAFSLCVSVLSTYLWITLVAQFISGLMMPLVQIGLNTLILQKTNEGYIGRVNGILIPLYTASMVIASSIAGKLKDQLSLFGIYGIAFFVFMVALFVIIPSLHLPNGRKSKLTH